MYHYCSTISPRGWRYAPASSSSSFGIRPTTTVFLELFLCTVIALLLLPKQNEVYSASIVPTPLVMFPTIVVVGLVLLLPSHGCSSSPRRCHCYLSDSILSQFI
mmetsp:Transcript_48434/g.52352  ORF Transcript_48434/g.52352 Transcript_48434/m.52352 type:complete len:104 (+) Transcript_48434:77-388(+)